MQRALALGFVSGTQAPGASWRRHSWEGAVGESRAGRAGRAALWSTDEGRGDTYPRGPGGCLCDTGELHTLGVA